MSNPPTNIRIYHIAHIDRLPSIIADGHLWSDAETRRRVSPGTSVGMAEIKDRRLGQALDSRPGLTVGQCVPFYFCPRSVMLYLLHRGNHHGLTYGGGQTPIIHMVADFYQAVDWASQANLRWAFTLSNAGSVYFEDRCEVNCLSEINWEAVRARQWSGNGVSPSVKEGKQAEFLVEKQFPWELILGIGVFSKPQGDQVTRLIADQSHRPQISIQSDWYY